MKQLIADVLLFAGAGAVSYGISLLWLPGGFVFGGFALVVLGLAAARP